MLREPTATGASRVADMVAGYRALLAERGYDWGGEIQGGITTLLQFADRCDPARWNAVFDEWKANGTLADPVDDLVGALARPLPTGIALVSSAGVEVADPLPYALSGVAYPYHVVVPSDGARPGSVREVTVSGDRPDLEVAGHRARVVEPVPAGRLLLVADAVSRWSVLDERGGGWFPHGAPAKYDANRQPFFYGNEVTVDVPATRATVVVARGCEFRPVSLTVPVPAGEVVRVELAPERIYDAAARGWYGADLHVHLNYTGDLVWNIEDVADIQRGEGLHLLNLVASNYSTALVYDREALEHFAGRDLPWSDATTVTRFGLEYRNDVFGHLHAFNPGAAPARFYTGHARSDEPYDWPPNAVAIAELRTLGATIGYTHPVAAPVSADGSLAAVFDGDRARSYEARELVLDAALGLVDSVDLLLAHIGGTEYLYHRLLGCGLRLAATAGTDVMLSRSRGRLTSNPPGWCRAYADLRGAPLSAAGWQDAVRAGRTFVTNGPWLEFDVAGSGPGGTHVLARPSRVPITARVVGIGVERVEIVGPDGPVTATAVDGTAHSAVLSADIDLTGPTWLAAVARGGQHPLALGRGLPVYAHTSPVWIDIDGVSVARPADARWCLDWLHRFETLAKHHCRFATDRQWADLAELIEAAATFYRSIGGPD